ncbi:hypothetical protein C8J57DRAFT_1373282 [Mycena rebaudengoi]|nr:hypothetical protein C8J57DRAFT_1373282 [Mycena rebaudengoi]
MCSNPNARLPAPRSHPQLPTSSSRLLALLLFAPASVHHLRAPAPVLRRCYCRSNPSPTCPVCVVHPLLAPPSSPKTTHLFFTPPCRWPRRYFKNSRVASKGSSELHRTELLSNINMEFRKSAAKFPRSPVFAPVPNYPHVFHSSNESCPSSQPPDRHVNWRPKPCYC